jgi:hypothetical protein
MEVPLAARKNDPARHKKTPERAANTTVWRPAKVNLAIRGVAGNLDPERGGTPT